MLNSAELEFDLTGGSPWQLHCHQNQPAPQEGFEIDSKLGAVPLRAPEASREDLRPQAILKIHRPSSLDYRASHVFQVNLTTPLIEYVFALSYRISDSSPIWLTENGIYPFFAYFYLP